ncbi:DUF6529 family protein [Nocardia seriolae]|uniref:Uncharacterized protein n=1 Tax=Nocardia seriolae TaxID=37332 RepID=A0A0B8NMF6_9NOCA|nr:DUF6529 family protein [Nocardia seriolae]APA95829.1 hypothetical protein NS506_01761 [Nocardia seriolae]MTJ66060.1 hypothetical protein [Nocardia seriolae]MTJ75064.1 hypothetical protein [Nocardia seriolae]MTJ86021.1 hypothetical protein [Nocardia seriolae]MTK30017.1 hypothetical protein [Nocardia seriolae]
MSLLADVLTASRRNLIAAPVLLAGAAVAVALGVAGTHYWPGTRSLPMWGFSAPQIFKAYLSSLVLVFIVGQLLTAVWIYRFHAPKPVHVYHRLFGALAFGLSLPVAFYCLYTFGFQIGHEVRPRVVVHSLAGVACYGAFASKMLTLRLKRTPNWLLPVLGGLVFTSFVLAWLLASLWWFRTVGFAR